MCSTPHASQWFEGDATPPQDRGWWTSRKTCPWERLKTSWCSRSVRKTARNKDRGYLRDTVVKTSGRLYNEFYQPKEVSCKITESGEHTRCPRGRGVRQGGYSLPIALVDASCPSRTTSYFPIFLNIPKWRKNAIRTILESVYLPYHIPIPFRSLKRSGKCPLCIPLGLWYQ